MRNVAAIGDGGWGCHIVAPLAGQGAAHPVGLAGADCGRRPASPAAAVADPVRHPFTAARMAGHVALPKAIRAAPVGGAIVSIDTGAP